MYLAFDKVSNSCLGHYGNGDRVHDLLDHLWVTHPGYAALRSNVCRDTLEGHDGRSTGLFGYPCLTRRVS
jgi:hypothetical protein